MTAAAAADSSFITVPAGTFDMGVSNGLWNERPVTTVTLTDDFEIAAKPVTNAEFENFDPKHSARRGEQKTSQGDDDPVRFVSHDDASAFCAWRGTVDKEFSYRLPSEAEWEYAARKGAITDILVENWCQDTIDVYAGASCRDPVRRQPGADRMVIRGGPARAQDGRPSPTYRLSSVVGDRSREIGLRLVRQRRVVGSTTRTSGNFKIVDYPKPKSVPEAPAVDLSKPYFAEPIEYVKIPDGDSGPLYKQHNHVPSIAALPNGDLLAVWYSTIKEDGRELAVAASRLRQGQAAWDEADLFWDCAGKNDHAPALFQAKNGTLYHFNGLSVGEGWGDLACLMRTSTDNGMTWSAASFVQPDHQWRNMPIGSCFELSDGTIMLPCDAEPGPSGGSVLHASSDGGKTWKELSEGKPKPDFAAGKTGALIAGIHTGVDAVRDDLIVAVGRENNIDGHMPMSISTDRGVTWTYSATPFPGISGGQRAVLKKLREGPLMLISFTPKSTFNDAAGGTFEGSGLFAALSDDEGKTWPTMKLLVDGKIRTLNGQAWTKVFTMDATHAEPKGYMTAVQAPDGVIQLLSSGVHYRFNLAWLRAPNAAVAK